MKKIIAFLLAALLLLSLAACGGNQSQEAPAPVETQAPEDATLSPREEYALKKQQMEELLKEEEATTPTAVTYSTNGITYTFDSAFTPANEGADSAQHKYTSDTIWMTVEIFSNTFGYTTGQEIAERFVDDGNGLVDSRNGVYFVEKDEAVRGCYVDDSGYYWMIYGFVTSRGDYAAERDRLIDLCTSGTID